MKIEDVIPFVTQCLAADAVTQALAILDQDADTWETDYERALADKGVVLSVALGGGVSADSEARSVELDNHVVVSVVAKRTGNKTGHGSAWWAAKVLSVLTMAGGQVFHGHRGTALANPAYEIGPIRGGLSIYFVNFNVRTTDPLS